MKAIIAAMAATALLAGAAGSASADPHPYGYDNNNGYQNGDHQNGDRQYGDHQRGDHQDGYRQDGYRQDNGRHRGWGRDYGNDNGHHWRRGERMGYNDWNSYSRVDYRQHHLRQPPRGYEWRERNGEYVLAAITTGLIFSIIANGNR